MKGETIIFGFMMVLLLIVFLVIALYIYGYIVGRSWTPKYEAGQEITTEEGKGKIIRISTPRFANSYIVEIYGKKFNTDHYPYTTFQERELSVI